MSKGTFPNLYLYFTICPVFVVEAGSVLPLPFSLRQPVAEPDPVVARVLAHQRGQVALLQIGVDGRQVERLLLA